MRIALTLLLFAHGIAHFVGFAVPWRLVTPEVSFRPTVLGAAIDLGNTGVRAYGLVWLALAVGLALTAVALCEWRSGIGPRSPSLRRPRSCASSVCRRRKSDSGSTHCCSGSCVVATWS